MINESNLDEFDKNEKKDSKEKTQNVRLEKNSKLPMIDFQVVFHLLNHSLQH